MVKAIKRAGGGLLLFGWVGSIFFKLTFMDNQLAVSPFSNLLFAILCGSVGLGIPLFVIGSMLE